MSPPSNPASNESTTENVEKMSPEPDDTDSEWTADEDDEQIQGLMAMLSLKEQQEVTVPTATPPEPKQGTPVLANSFGALTQKRRIALTKQNLQIHTKDEALKHSMQKRLLQDPKSALSPRITTQGVQRAHLNTSLQRSHSSHHQLLGRQHGGGGSPTPGGRMPGRPYMRVHANMRPVNGALGSPHFLPQQTGMFTPPMVPIQQHSPYALNAQQQQQLPRPGLTHHLSINSLPPPTTNTNHMGFQ